MDKEILLLVLSAAKKISVTSNERIFEHLGVAYIAAYLRAQDYSVTIIDQNLLEKDLTFLIPDVVSQRPKLIGIACYQEAYPVLKEFVQVVKNHLPKTHLSLGGVFASNAYPIIFREIPELDSVILGDGELVFLELAEAIFQDKDWRIIPHLTYPQDSEAKKKTPKYDTDLNFLPNPVRDTLPLVIERGLFPIISASRGCYGSCSYCSITTLNRQRRCREMDKVILEMEKLYLDYRTDYFYFIDDTFIGGSKQDYQRIEYFAKELIQRRNLRFQFSIECRANEVNSDLLKLLREAGLHSVFLGLESGYQPTLDLLHKGVKVEQNLRAVEILNELGIRYNIGFIMFHPFTSLREIEANLNFLMHTEQKNFLDSLHRKLMVFYNTPIAKTLKTAGIVCQPWYDTSISFVEDKIQDLYEFIEQFAIEIKPGINQLAVHYTQTDDLKTKKRIAKLHSHLCTTYIETMFQYTQEPDAQLLVEQMQYLLQKYNSTLNELQIAISS